jgi:poly(3-hydroxybutyrate) depolymerase
VGRLSARVKRIAAALCALALAACAATTGEPTAIQRTWDNAPVYLPGQVTATSVSRIPTDTRRPVLIYLHGCTGLAADAPRWGETMRNLGFIVIQPDSFARPGRRPNCDPRSNTTGYFPGVRELRDEEVRFAVAQAQKAPWADPDRIFVLGHSEGGFVAMRSVVPGVRATIVSGYYCAIPSIPHPNAHPLLILEWQTDPWNRRGTSCEGFTRNRSATTFVRIQGNGHSTATSAEALAAVRGFVQAQLARP